MSSSVPALQITATGVVAPDAVTIRNGVLADENVAFGGDLDIVTPSTPQAFLADQLTANIRDSNAAIAYFVSQVDPATAEGRMQDAIARIYFLERNGATASVVQAQCVGQPGAILPAGSLAKDDAGNLWSSTGDATFPPGGMVTVQFACQVLGPITLGIGELTQIGQLVPGWDAITNLSPAVVGSEVESRANFEQRRQESVAINSKGTPAAIRAAVFDVPGVLDVFVYDNYTNAVLPYGVTNYPIAPHSVYVAAIGGEAQAIAEAIWSRKDLGCDMNGNTTVNVEDRDGYSYPYPVYPIKFQIPDALPIKFMVQIANNQGLPANIVELVKASIMATFTGANGAQRARMGGSVFASSYYGAVAAIAPSVLIIQIKVGTVMPNLDQVEIGIDQAPTLDMSDIGVSLV